MIFIKSISLDLFAIRKLSIDGRPFWLFEKLYLLLALHLNTSGWSYFPMYAHNMHGPVIT